MQNSLFTLNSVTGSDGVTGSDVVFGKTQGKSPHGRFTENNVTTCHSVTKRAEAIVLKANLERRGVLLRAENGAVVCDGASVVLDRFAHEIVRLKPALLELLRRDEAPDDDAATGKKSETGSAPDLGALSVAVEGARRGAHLSPTPELTLLWKELQAYIGVSLTSRHIGAAARMVDGRAHVSNGELLEMFAAGLQPDEGDGKPVWIEPETLFDTMHAEAKASAKTSATARRTDPNKNEVSA